MNGYYNYYVVGIKLILFIKNYEIFILKFENFMVN